MTLTVVPTCPACGKTASQVVVRDLSDTEHEGTYCCPAEHIWTTKWFATERSA